MTIYIPIWWYSNYPLFCKSHQEMQFTFQSGDIQIRNPRKQLLWTAYIYIPIWWYSNLITHLITSVFFLFTFQSGDIQINLYVTGLTVALVDLHSNLVIFKLEWIGRQIKMTITFTFQSGDIQMGRRKKYTSLLPNLHSNLVIFKF